MKITKPLNDNIHFKKENIINNNKKSLVLIYILLFVQLFLNAHFCRHLGSNFSIKY